MFTVHQLAKSENCNEEATFQRVSAHLLPAIQGFFRTIALSPQGALQDTLRLLSLWFKYGCHPEVEAVLLEGFEMVSIDTWLQVLPQIIARIHTSVKPVRRLIHELLMKVGRAHPQPLVYSLTVASKSLVRRLLSARVARVVRQHDPNSPVSVSLSLVLVLSLSRHRGVLLPCR